MNSTPVPARPLRRRVVVSIALLLAAALSAGSAARAEAAPSDRQTQELRTLLVSVFMEASQAVRDIHGPRSQAALTMPTLNDFRTIVADIRGPQTASWYASARRAGTLQALPAQLRQIRLTAAAERRAAVATRVPRPETPATTALRVALGSPIRASTAKFCQVPISSAAIFGQELASGVLRVLIESLTPAGVFVAPAVAALAIAAGVIDTLVLTQNFANDEADCTDDTLLEVAASADANLVKSFTLQQGIGKGVNDILDLLKKQATAAPAPPAAPGPATPPPPPTTTVVNVPDNLDAILAALADTRASVQRTVAADSQVLSNKLQLVQGAIERLSGSGGPPTSTEDSGLRLAIEQALAAPAGTTPLGRFLLPSASNGLLDGTGLSVRSVVTSMMNDATSAGLSYDREAAQAALDSGDAAAADKDFRQAFRRYQVAYAEVVR